MPRTAPNPRRSAAASTPAVATESSLRFDLQNWILLATGLVAIVLGYVLLARGSTVAAPLLLVAGYVGLIPLGIIRQGA